MYSDSKQQKQSKESKSFSDFEPLKKTYPDVAQRKKLCDDKLLKAPRGVFVRMEPHPLASFNKIVYATFLLPPHYKIAYVNGTLSKKLDLRPEEGLFFFVGQKIVNLNHTFQEMHAKYKEEDNILYIHYADVAKF